MLFGVALKKIIILIFFTFLLLSFSFSSFAALNKSSGVYVEGNIATASKSGWAGLMNVGYKFTDSVALESGLSFFHYTYEDIVLKNIIPFNNGVKLFFKVGPAMKNFNTNHLKAYGDVGVSYAFTPNTSGNTQLVWISDGNYCLAIGVTYIF